MAEEGGGGRVRPDSKGRGGGKGKLKSVISSNSLEVRLLFDKEG